MDASHANKATVTGYGLDTRRGHKPEYVGIIDMAVTYTELQEARTDMCAQEKRLNTGIVGLTGSDLAQVDAGYFGVELSDKARFALHAAGLTVRGSSKETVG